MDHFVLHGRLLRDSIHVLHAEILGERIDLVRCVRLGAATRDAVQEVHRLNKGGVSVWIWAGDNPLTVAIDALDGSILPLSIHDLILVRLYLLVHLTVGSQMSSNLLLVLLLLLVLFAVGALTP